MEFVAGEEERESEREERRARRQRDRRGGRRGGKREEGEMWVAGRGRFLAPSSGLS